MKFMNYLKNHKILYAIAIVLLIIIIGTIILVCLLSGSRGNNEYGNRLDGIENYEIGNSQVSDLKDNIGSLENVKKVTYNLQGKLVNIIIEVDDSVAIDTSKEYANKALEFLDDDQKSFYDVQIFITSSNNKSETYPIIGYKNKASAELVWKK